MFTLPDQYIQVNDIRTRYWEVGEGPVVLLLHGLTEHVELWHLTIPALLSHFRVIALDCLGHGRTEKPLNGSYDFDSLTRFVKDFMDVIGIKHTHIVGHSLGGALAAKLAILSPDSVTSLVLQDAAGLGREIGKILRILSVPVISNLLIKTMAEDDFTRFERGWRAGLVDSSSVSKEFVYNVWEMLNQPNMDQVILRILRQSATFLGVKKSTYGPILAGLPGIQQPTLILWGKQDTLVPAAHGIRAAGLLPNARLALLDGCGHVPCLEEPDQTNRLILDFLVRVNAKPEDAFEPEPINA